MSNSSNKSDPRERRLKSIYDSLDSGNNKKAVQEADKLLRKDGTALSARALKSLALFRAGRVDEAAMVMHELESMKPSDDGVLQTMMHYYRESQQYQSMVAAYETAVQQQPKNEDLLCCLFMCYVRVMDYKKQQLTASKLHKLQPAQSGYYYWTVMSIVMQAIRSKDEQLINKMLLPLAARMVEQQLDKMQGESEANLYLMILEQQQRHDDCLTQLDGKLGQLFNEHSRRWLPAQRRSYLLKLQRNSELYSQLRAAVAKEPNDWLLWKQLIDCALAADGQDCRDVLRLVKETASSREPPPSAPQLVKLQLLLLLLNDEKAKSDLESMRNDLGDPIDLAVEYFQQFRYRPTTASELLMFKELFAGKEQLLADKLLQFRPVLPGDSSDTVGENAVKRNGNNDNDDDDDNNNDNDDDNSNAAKAQTDEAKRKLRRNICCVHNYEQIRRGLQLHQQMTSSQRQQLVRSLITNSRKCQLEDMRSTEQQPADDLALLAVALIYDNWVATDGKDQRLLYVALFLLDETLEQSPSNHAVIVWMVRLFVSLGAWMPASGLFERLDVKQILLDGLGYLITRQVNRCGQLSHGLAILNSTCAFYKTSYKDIAEHLCTAYRLGNFRKVTEIDGLHSRLSSSLEYNYCNIEMRYLSLLLSGPKIVEGAYEMGADPSTELLDLESIIDTRDFNVIRDAAYDLQPEFESELTWLRWRCLGIRCLTCMAKCATELASTGNADLVQNKANWQLLLDQLQQLQLDYNNSSSNSSSSSSSSCYKVQPHPRLPYPTNLSFLINNCESAALLASILKFITRVPLMEQRDQHLLDAMAIIDRQLLIVKEGQQQQQQQPPLLLNNSGSDLPVLCQLAESICLLTLGYELALLALSSKLSANKKQRRQAEIYCKQLRNDIAAKTMEVLQFVQQLADNGRDSVGNAAEQFVQNLMNDGVKSCSSDDNDDNDNDLLSLFSIANSSINKVAENVCQSQLRSLQDLLSLLQVKAKFTDPARYFHQ